MELDDQIAFALLALILIVTLTISTPGNRWVFDFMLVSFAIIYILHKFSGGRRKERKEVEESLRSADTRKMLQKSYWNSGEERPGGGDTI